jgi:hypothetical protein
MKNKNNHLLSNLTDQKITIQRIRTGSLHMYCSSIVHGVKAKEF